MDALGDQWNICFLTCESLNTSQSSVSCGNCSSFILVARPMEFQLTETQNKLNRCSVVLMLFFWVVLSSTVVCPTKYSYLSLHKFQFSSVQWSHCVLNGLQAESQDDHGIQLFCFLLSAITVMHCLLSNVLKVFFLNIYFIHLSNYLQWEGKIRSSYSIMVEDVPNTFLALFHLEWNACEIWRSYS